jgi:glycosyltransferase involved in cell wall biosynthesis
MKVLLVHPSFLPASGGSTTVAAWMVEALRRKHDLTVLTWQPLCAAAVDRMLGTSLGAGGFTVLRPPALLRAAVDAATALKFDPGSVWRWAVLMRLTRGMGCNFDTIVSASGEADTGEGSIQYVHYPYLAGLYDEDQGGDSWWARFHARAQRLRPWRLVYGLSFPRLLRQTMLVNSDWTGSVVRARYGIDPITVYPPVPSDFPDVPWTRRADGFICLARLKPSKKIERVIDIVNRVRACHPQIRLHLVGFRETGRFGVAYRQQLIRLAKEHSWLSLHEDLPRAELVRLVADQRYGIHAKEQEHFGIGVAEMVQAGCIVFTPASGGPAEILGHDSRLLYDGALDAVARISSVMDSTKIQNELREHLALQAKRFTAPRFMSRLNEIVSAQAGIGRSTGEIVTPKHNVRNTVGHGLLGLPRHPGAQGRADKNGHGPR